MAESILHNVAGNIVTKLGSFACRELGLLWGVNDGLDKLKHTLSNIQAVLLDAEEQQSKSRAVKDWVLKLKDAFYDIDDLIDEFSFETLRRQVMAKDGRKTKLVRIFFSKSNQIAFRLKMGHKIKEIRERLKAINDDKTQFNFFEHVIDMRDDVPGNKRETGSYILEDEVIGRNDEKETIINLLLNTNTKEDIAVISIVGMGGLGKTTLAQSVYNDNMMTKHFELKLWVCISDIFDVKDISEKIIESAEGRRPEPSQMHLLQTKLKSKIDGKKYLLVMDDVWNENYEKWVALKRLVVGGAKGSRILITTRSKQVAETFDTTSLYSLKTLDERNSWILFKKMAFLKGAEEELENPDLVKIGKEIVAKLKGVPLTIRTIGRLLYTKKSKDLWSSFKDKELYQVMEQRDLDDMRSILELSYNHLPSNLKQCFLYCALFPKDSNIQKEKVINQWVAQGFIQPYDETKSFDIGEEYFMELLWRSFFQDIKKNELGVIIEFKMHDLMHDLACSLVENECVRGDVNARVLINKRTRHISFDLSPYEKFVELPRSLFEAKNLRTLFLGEFSNSLRRDYNYSKVLEKIIDTSLQLRTLELSYTSEIFSKSISRLKHLRYLDIRMGENIQFLPNSITELYNLETLILQCSFGLKELPRDTKNLINLKHLDICQCKALTRMPKGIGELINLQTMNLFVSGMDNDGGLSELNGLNKLRGTLTIKGLEFRTPASLQKNAKYLQLKSGLQKLKLYWEHSFYEPTINAPADNYEGVLECLQPHSNVREIHIEGYQGVKLCNWLSSNSLSHLVTIQLSFCNKLQHLPRFDQFPCLKHLRLNFLLCIEYIDNNDYLSSSTFFPCLEELSIVNMPSLKRWWKGTSTESAQNCILFPAVFPCLSQLKILGCPRLEMIPWNAPSKSLEIGDSIEYPFEGDEFDVEQWKHFLSLSSLWLCEISKWECLLEGLPYVTTLQHFSIRGCPTLTNLPESIGNLNSLSNLEIYDCPKLTSLPEGIRHLPCIQSLIIRGCPILKERCKKETGDDWPKIAHIQHVDTF